MRQPGAVANGALHGEHRAASEFSSPSDQLLVPAAFGIQLEAPQQSAIGAQGHRHVGVFVGVDADHHIGAGAALAGRCCRCVHRCWVWEGGATSQADGQATDGTVKSDSYEVTGLPGWLPHHTDRQVSAKDTSPGRIGSGKSWVRPALVGSRNHQSQWVTRRCWRSEQNMAGHH
jgi:hypothetical protein